MDAPARDELLAMARELGVTFPPMLVDVLCAAVDLLQRALPGCRVVRAAEESRRLRAGKLGATYVPFVVSPAGSWDDLFCLDFPASGPEPTVCVFADHAIVAEWTDVAAWISWLRAEAARA